MTNYQPFTIQVVFPSLIIVDAKHRTENNGQKVHKTSMITVYNKLLTGGTRLLKPAALLHSQMIKRIKNGVHWNDTIRVKAWLQDHFEKS